MSGRPEKRNGRVHARDETTGPDDAVFGCFGCFRRLALLRAASSARTTRTWRLGDAIRDQTIRDRFRFQSCAVLAAYIPHGLQDRHQEASKQLQTTSKY